jgi:hypothetical protein
VLVLLAVAWLYVAHRTRPLLPGDRLAMAVVGWAMLAYVCYITLRRK